MDPINGRPIRFGLVGCGRIATRHFDAMEAQRGACEIAAVCDVDEKALSAAVERTGARGHQDLSGLIAGADLDCVVLCTPSGLHPRQAIAAARAGKHVITEKPMATRWQDGLDMVRAFDDERKRLFVVKQNRTNPTLRLVKRAVQDGRFGKIHMVAVNVFWTRPQAYYDSAPWRGTWELDGGAFMNQASHYVDLLSWLVGPVASVHAMMGTLGRSVEVEDTGVMNVRWRSGALGSVNVTMLTYPKNLEGSITILGERGSVQVGGVALNEIRRWDFDAPEAYDETTLSASYETDSVYGVGHLHYYENVIQVLQGEAEPETDGREGLTSLEILVAAYLSARDGRTVSLPLEY